MNEPLSLISLNTNGLGEVKKRGSTIGWLKNTHKAKDKIIFLQETHTTKKSESIWKKEWNEWEIFFSSGGSNCKGVATFIPKSMNYKINEVNSDPNGRYLAINITINNVTYCLINCYAPNKPNDRIIWLAPIQEIIQKNEDTK